MTNIFRALPFFIVSLLFCSIPAWATPKLDVTPAVCALQGMELAGVPWFKENLSNGLEDFMFDLNGDGLSDIEFLVPQGDENRIPLFYWVNGEDGTARYTLVDSLRDGTCTKMKIIWHKYQPNWRKGA